MTLREHAAQQLDACLQEWGYEPPDDREEAIGRWVDRLIATGDIPDEILAAMPEVSRFNEPQISPQQYECGCVAVTRITDRDCRVWRNGGEKPFEMRLALPCASPACELAELRSKES